MDHADALSLERLELLAYSHRHEEATGELLRLLAYLDARQGGLSAIGTADSRDLQADHRDAHYATRIAAAIGSLFSKVDLQLSDLGFQRLIPLQRWLAMIFGASPLENADHIIRLLSQEGHAGSGEIALRTQDLSKFCLLYSLDSNIPLPAENLWHKHKGLAAAFFSALLASRIVATRQAQEKKEGLLSWLPSRLAEITLDDIPFAILHDVWMHCSYAHTADKHSIKQAINQLIRKKLIALGFRDRSAAPERHERKRVVMCVVEWFRSDHAMYRGHSLSIEALKRKYHLIGVSLRAETDEVSAKVFDEVHRLPNSGQVLDLVHQVVKLSQAVNPDIVYYPSVGMFPETVFLANLRLAPIQIVGLGHPATTYSSCIDYAVVDGDCIGDAGRFSEKLVALPPGPQRVHPNAGKIPPKIRRSPELVKVAVTASVMKFNHSFLTALKQIGEQSPVRIEFHLFCMAAFGLSKVYLQNIVRSALGERVVMFPHLPYPKYLENLNDCDMFLCPFPFGNTNGIVDTVRLGLPGVCLTGAEVHSHIDEALFKRLGLPTWTIASSVDDYVRAAVRLAGQSAEREKIARELVKTDPDVVLFGGDASCFCDVIDWLERNHESLRNDTRKLIIPPSAIEHR